MRLHLAAPVLCCLCAAACAQDVAPAQEPSVRRRSLADGLVRQAVEVGKIVLPAAGNGLEVGAGEGPLVLMIRRADGTLEVQELDRGPGDHGRARDEARIDQPAEEEVPEGGKAEAERPAAPATVRITRRGEDLAIGSAEAPQAWTGKQIAAAPVLAMLREQFARTRDTKVAGQLLLEVGGDAWMQELLTTWSLARDAGFTVLMLSPQGCDASARADDRATLRGLPAQFGWQGQRVGPQRRVTIYDAELLIALDGPVRVRDLAPWFTECAKVGIWRIGFVCQKDAKTRVKVPTDLPFDRGL